MLLITERNRVRSFNVGVEIGGVSWLVGIVKDALDKGKDGDLKDCSEVLSTG